MIPIIPGKKKLHYGEKSMAGALFIFTLTGLNHLFKNCWYLRYLSKSLAL
jgi:hypothetical protein